MVYLYSNRKQGIDDIAVATGTNRAGRDLTCRARFRYEELLGLFGCGTASGSSCCLFVVHNLLHETEPMYEG